MLVKIESYEVVGEQKPTAIALQLENGASFLMGSIPEYIGAELSRMVNGLSEKNEFFLLRELRLHGLFGKKVEINIITGKKENMPFSIFSGNEKIFGKTPEIISLGKMNFAHADACAGKLNVKLSGLAGIMAAAMLSAEIKYNGKKVKNIAALAKGAVPLIALDTGGKQTPVFMGVDPHQMIFLGGYDYAKREYTPMVADRHGVESMVYMLRKSNEQLKEIRISGMTSYGIYVAEAVLSNGVSLPIIPSNALLLKEIFAVTGYVDDALIKIQQKMG